ncbi:MAG: transketolase family protein [Acidobacteria bacterium]|nr:transketolase family protein [Acidobacteriota bacterium]MBU4307862.1 transketolase family protein [Acidobacteriota bacterium]MCG2811000.1 transketolase family protein [Candidatus Aminicenantes bacterium]
MAVESLRGAYGKTLLKLGREIPDLVVLDADLAKSTQTQVFAKEFAGRFIDMGLAEQDMVSTAAGIALTGKTVFASSFCTFLVGRVFDQIRQSVCYNRANVKLVGTHSGLGVGEDGATHQSLEDIALTRALPEIRIIVPADAVETSLAVEYAAATPGPFFIRLTRNNLPTLFGTEHRFIMGRAPLLRDGSDITLIAMGAMVEKALQAAELLAAAQISAAVIDFSSLKPLDEDILLRFAKKTGHLVTIEDHSVHGGLGSACAEFLSQQYPVPMKIMGMDNQFGRSGKPEDLYVHFKLTAADIAGAGKEILSRP